MADIQSVFGRPRVLLPVIHPRQGIRNTLESVEAVADAGVRGIFLINQGMSIETLIRLHDKVKEDWPWMWVGLNFLGRHPRSMLGLEPDGIWTDNAGIDEASRDQPIAKAFWEDRGKWEGLYFGGVAFKYQREVPTEKLTEAAILASSYMDVICTSGSGTGMPAEVEKVKAIKAGATKDVALASGVTIDNVDAYLPYVSAYLVGTGIEKAFGIVDYNKVVALLKVIES